MSEPCVDRGVGRSQREIRIERERQFAIFSTRFVGIRERDARCTRGQVEADEATAIGDECFVAEYHGVKCHRPRPTDGARSRAGPYDVR